MELRDYQTAAIQSIYDYFAEGRGSAPLVVAPTGAGKSVILAEFMRRAHADYPGTRILLATHRKELIQQDYQALLRLWPAAPAGIYSAGLGQRRHNAQMLFAGVQSIFRKTRTIGHVDLMIVDEAHLIGRGADTQYGKLIDGLRDINPAMKLVGLTATPYRLDSGRLDSGKGALFDGISYDIGIPMLVERGYLAPLVSKRPGTAFNAAGLHTRMGDFIEAEMAARFATEAITREAVAEIIAAGADRRSWLLFCISVDHAVMARDELRRQGIVAEVVTGATPHVERDRILRDFKAGRIRALTSVAVLTTGFDAPAIDLLAFLRPTQSLSLYMQMAGRGMRVKPQGGNCLVLDFAGNVARHGPVDAVQMPGEKKEGTGGGEAPTKTCPRCDSILLIAARDCPDCGHVFPEPEPKIEATATTEAIMNMTAEDNWHPVADFEMGRHVKNGTESLRVEYLIDGKVVKEWICLEHTGFPRRKAVQWWVHHAGTSVPDTVTEALARRAEIRVPGEAVILREGKYWRIARVRGAGAVA